MNKNLMRELTGYKVKGYVANGVLHMVAVKPGAKLHISTELSHKATVVVETQKKEVLDVPSFMKKRTEKKRTARKFKRL